MAQISIQKAFEYFANRVLQGDEGVFFSEKEGGNEQWIFGLGNKINADFERGPFPFFSLVSFLGDQKYFWHFEEWYSPGKPFPEAEIQKITSPWNIEKKLSNYSSETEESFAAKVEKVRNLAANGEVWVLNLAHELSGDLGDEKVLFSVFDHFLNLGKDHCGGIIWNIEQKMCSMSPEIFLHQKGNIISTFPIKGTGTKNYLETNQKEVSELAMVTDLLRNDLGQIADHVWMKNERVLVNRGDFWDAHSEIFAELPSDILTWDQYHTLLPGGSISGAPKKRVTEYVLKLEDFDRGFYTGTFGVKFSPSESIFNILIRTLFAEQGKWRFPVGAGITYESDAVAEWKETLQKAEILRECVAK